jgi:hypothetical protein
LKTLASLIQQSAVVLVACTELLGEADSTFGHAKRQAEVWRKERLIEQARSALARIMKWPSV